MKKYSLLALLLLSVLGGVTQRKYAILNPGETNCISVAPLSFSEASSVKSYEDKSGLTYRWIGLPSWATPNGSSFTGVPPLGLTGMVPVTVEYGDGKGRSGSFTFTLNYGNNSSSSQIIDNQIGNLNIVEGLTGFGNYSSNVNQLILLPDMIGGSSSLDISNGFNTNMSSINSNVGVINTGVINPVTTPINSNQIITTTTNYNSNIIPTIIPSITPSIIPSIIPSQTTTISNNSLTTTTISNNRNGLNCNLIANNLNSANSQLSSDMNNFTSINNQIASSNTTLVNLKFKQTELTKTINQLRNNDTSSGTGRITQSISIFQNNITTVQAQILTINSKILQDQNRLSDLQNQRSNIEQRKVYENGNLASGRQNVTNAEASLNVVNANIQSIRIKITSIKQQFETLTQTIEVLNRNIDKSNGRINTAQSQLNAAIEDQNRLFNNRTQLIVSLSQINSTMVSTQGRLNQLLNEEKMYKQALDNANYVLKSMGQNSESNRQIQNINRQIQTLQSTISDNKLLLSQLEAQVVQYNQRLSSLQIQLRNSQTNNDAEYRVSEYRNQLRSINVNIQQWANNLELLQNQYAAVLSRINRGKDLINKYTNDLEICKFEKAVEFNFNQDDSGSSYNDFARYERRSSKDSDRYKSGYYSSSFESNRPCETSVPSASPCCDGPCTVPLADSLRDLKQSMGNKLSFFGDDKFFK